MQIGTPFLDHFSEQLYSSPQKAFEELISNGWDAGARVVDVRIPDDLAEENAALSVLDDGASMNVDGLRQLWEIATSHKAEQPQQWGRNMVGKFGIGKLATYILANKFTYICKAEDGVIRRVTMDYSALAEADADGKPKFISDLPLDMYEVTEENVVNFVSTIPQGETLADLIKNGLAKPAFEPWDDEFLAEASAFTPPPSGTWTLVLLTELKEAGQQLKTWLLKRMLRAALPFGSEMAIILNDEQLTSSKIDSEIAQEWEIGPKLGISKIKVRKSDLGIQSAGSESEAQLPFGDLPEDAPGEEDEDEYEEFEIESSDDPVPHVKIPNIDGIVTGRVRLFQNEISGGKSEERGASNGFHVNVLGRVVNQGDPYFGEKNMSHSPWARFRMTVRADGLNRHLIINREKFHDRPELAVFRAFLKQAFNKVRTAYDSDNAASLTDTSDVLVKSLGVVSLNPLRTFVSKALEAGPVIPEMIDDKGVDDPAAKLDRWREETADDIRNSLSQVKFEETDTSELIRFRLTDNSIVINRSHPFSLEYARNRREKRLMEAFSSVTFLSDVYALDLGIDPTALRTMMEYRDRLMRARAVESRKSGVHIAVLLSDVQNDSNYRMLEAVLSTALDCLGFDVEDLAKPGEPEGIARAYPLPSGRPTKTEPATPLYTVSFDAKSSTKEKAATGNLSLDGIHDHKELYDANYALVVAPDFQEGALPRRAEQQEVTPMRARTLGKLMEITAEHGAIPLDKLKEVFELYDPDEVDRWVDVLPDWIRGERILTLDLLLEAFNVLKGQIPDSLSASTISLTCRKDLGAPQVTDEQVIAVASGLNVLVPDLIGLDGDKIVVNASSERVSAAVEAQLEVLHSGQIAVVADEEKS